MPGTGGGKCRTSIWAASADCSGQRLELGRLADVLRAGTWPALAQSSDCWLIQLMNTRAARLLFSSGVLQRRQHELVRAGPGAGLAADLGSAATPHSRLFFSAGC